LSQEGEGGAGDTFVTQSAPVRDSLHRFLSRSRITVTQTEQPEVTSVAHGPLSDASSDDGAIDAAMSHGSPPGSSAAQPGADELGHSSDDDSETEIEDGCVGELQLQKPEWQLLSHPARVPPGQERNPVYRWHNAFVDVRHRGRNQMQVCAAASASAQAPCVQLFVL
jgi:hypothetical protein